MKNKLSHIDENNQPTMVDVSNKSITKRIATAQTLVLLPKNIKQVINEGDIMVQKGPVFQTAIIAGVMAAKKTHELIPFCHPLALENCKINIELDTNNNLIITCECKTSGKTGVEMEALTGSSIAALTVYDMCKALSHDIIIEETKLLQKSGGKSDFTPHN